MHTPQTPEPLAVSGSGVSLHDLVSATIARYLRDSAADFGASPKQTSMVEVSVTLKFDDGQLTWTRGSMRLERIRNFMRGDRG